jgi:homoserine O-acetyltransferase/O-succinyltransferase
MDAAADTSPARETDGGVWRFPAAQPLRLESGARLAPLEVAYKTYGRLNETRSNAVLVCHALTGDQYVAEPHPVTGKEGWWEQVVGPGRPIDTGRYFVICANVLGGCMGSTGPRSPRDDGGGLWGTDFPPVTIHDMVRAQKMLIDHLGISRLFAVLGGSMGGMQVLQWAASYPDAVFAALPIASAGATGRASAFPRAAWRWRGCARTSRICPRRR